MNISTSIEQLKRWKDKHISDKSFILLISTLVGLIAGLAAVLLKISVHFIHHQLNSEKYNENYTQLLYPILGLLFTVLLAKALYKESSVGHAISDILYSISRKQSIIEKGKTYSRWVTSVITVGLGGSVGLESPIVLTGGAIGSNIGRLLSLDYKQRTLLIGCGIGGAISAIFNAPIGGLIFTIEVILTGLSVSNFIPLLIACVSATILSNLLAGDEILFTGFNIVDEIHLSDVPVYIILGVVTGSTALFFNTFLHKLEHILEHYNPYMKALLGGGILSILIIIAPPIFGEGYIAIEHLLHKEESELVRRSLVFSDYFTEGWLFLFYMVLVTALKIVASSITLSAGGSGGTFAPSMVLGGLAGFVTARALNLLGVAEVSEINFTLVGMSGVLCGVQYAPLTAIFLIADITGGYTLFIPLMLVSAISYVTVTFFQQDSPHVRALKERGEYIDDNDEDTKILDRLNINKLIETDLLTVQEDALLGDLVQVISRSRRNLFPVLNDKQQLVGIITLDDVRDVMFDHSKHQTLKVEDLKRLVRAKVRYGEKMQDVMEKFEKTNAWNLPVVDDEGRYMGVVSKSHIFGVYRKQLIRLNKSWINS
ncbi:chloride channel protein [Algivirga pacifica]|uniref:Chloride channel protein n=1 Tax=Algivirga pacifica TaxID=1162670 RepID=A0ABP9DGL3_9BACT